MKMSRRDCPTLPKLEKQLVKAKPDCMIIRLRRHRHAVRTFGWTCVCRVG